MEPPSRNAADLARASGRVWSFIESSFGRENPAVWVMQGWFFLSGGWSAEEGHAYLSGVPTESTLVLDLMSEVDPQYWVIADQRPYFGRPFVWNMLHNFGGSMGLFGSAQNVLTGLTNLSSVGNLFGVGVTPEGTLQNYPMYELALELAWYDLSLSSVEKWFDDYAIRRYDLKDRVKQCQVFHENHNNHNDIDDFSRGFLQYRSQDEKVVS